MDAKLVYDGVMRQDPVYPDLLSIMHAENESINLDDLLEVLKAFRTEFTERFSRKGLEYGYQFSSILSYNSFK